MKEALKADLRDRIAEMKKLKEPMHLASFQYEQGVVLTGDEAKLFLELLETLPSPGEGVVERLRQTRRNLSDVGSKQYVDFLISVDELLRHLPKKG